MEQLIALHIYQHTSYSLALDLCQYYTFSLASDDRNRLGRILLSMEAILTVPFFAQSAWAAI